VYIYIFKNVFVNMNRALSGSITSFILIIAAVALAIVVVSLAFSYMGYFAYTNGQLMQIGAAYVNHNGQLTITIKNTFHEAKIVGVIFSYTLHNVNYNLSSGTHTYTINTGFDFSSQQVSLTLVIEVNGQNTIYLPVTANLVQ